jgi:peptidoglycan-N-acetylglucosamine deacetylase
MDGTGRGRSARARALVSATLAALTAISGVSTTLPAQAAVRPCSNGLVALTFDDGPATAVTGRLLDVLSNHRVPATFFVVGSRVDASPALVRTAHQRGFVIANHTYRHETLTRLSDAGIRGTLRRTNEAIQRAGARPAGLMRPPYGATNSRVRQVASGMGLTQVLWDVDPRDWESGTASQITSRVLAQLRPWGRNIVLLHDGVRRSPTTLAAVPGIIRGARERGYCFARLGAAGKPVPPVPRMSVSDAKVTEADPGTTVQLRFHLTLDRPTSRPVSVRVRTVPGTATPGDDYGSVVGRVGLPAGTLTRTVTVGVYGDRIHEGTEWLRLVADGPEGVVLHKAEGRGTILDNDPLP